MAASFPSSVKSFTTKTNSTDIIDASHINDHQDETVAIENVLLGNTAADIKIDGDITTEERFIAKEGGDTTTPASGYVSLYAKADGKLYSKDDAGAESLVSGALSTFTIDAVGLADAAYSGMIQAGTAGAILAVGDLCYFAVADSKWELTDADAEATAFGKLGICVQAAAEDAATTMLLWGSVRADAAFPSFTIGAPVFVDVTAGDVSNTAPSGSGDIVRVIGYGNTANELHFCPENSYLELA